eukprot:scaffold317_cov260-Pinguiococcus_pyrenoidosus.AAC.54
MMCGDAETLGEGFSTPCISDICSALAINRCYDRIWVPRNEVERLPLDVHAAHRPFYALQLLDLLDPPHESHKRALRLHRVLLDRGGAQLGALSGGSGSLSRAHRLRLDLLHLCLRFRMRLDRLRLCNLTKSGARLLDRLPRSVPLDSLLELATAAGGVHPRNHGGECRWNAPVRRVAVRPVRARRGELGKRLGRSARSPRGSSRVLLRAHRNRRRVQAADVPVLRLLLEVRPDLDHERLAPVVLGHLIDANERKSHAGGRRVRRAIQGAPASLALALHVVHVIQREAALRPDDEDLLSGHLLPRFILQRGLALDDPVLDQVVLRVPKREGNFDDVALAALVLEPDGRDLARLMGNLK